MASSIESKRWLRTIRDAFARVSVARGKRERHARRDGLLTGRLVDHGRETYRHDPREPMSYFVKLETPRGDRTIWGVDLEGGLMD